MIFNWQTLLVTACCSGSLLGSVILMDDGNQLTGEVTKMDESGEITVVSPISQAPLKVNGSVVRQIDFGTPENSSQIPDQRLILTNGDVLPVRVNSLTADMISVSSPDFGSFEVERKVVDSIQLGIVPERVIYTGLVSLDGWVSDENNPESWQIRGNEFVAISNGTIGRDVALSEKFIIRFNLSWKNRPNIRFFFADPLKKMGVPADRYFLQFAGAGMELKRESTGKSRYSTVALIGLTPDRFPEKKVAIEIRMDRSTGLIQFYLDGVLEGSYADRISNIPAGSGVAFQNQAAQESEQKIQDFEILEWDDRGDRHRSEDRGDGKNDSLIGRFGERFSGEVAEVRSTKEGAVYVFKSDFTKGLIELPEEEVSTVFFKKKEQDLSAVEGLILKLRGGGEVRVSTCEFEGKTVKIVHPLLGPVELDRRGIVSLERRVIPKAKIMPNQ